MIRIVVLTALAAVLVSAANAYSHHSAAAVYNVQDEAQIEGELAQVALRNPHSWIFVMAPDENGAMKRWGVEWGAARQLTEQGAANSLRVGDKVVVTGNPGRDPKDYRMLMISIVRPADGFSWGLREGEVVEGARE